MFAHFLILMGRQDTEQTCRPPVGRKMAGEGGKRKRPFSRKRKKASAGGEGEDKAKPTEEVTAEEKHLRDRQRKLREIALRERAHGREYKKAKWRRTIQ